jgi:hypothetical protein
MQELIRAKLAVTPLPAVSKPWRWSGRRSALSFRYDTIQHNDTTRHDNYDTMHATTRCGMRADCAGWPKVRAKVRAIHAAAAVQGHHRSRFIA